MSRIVARTVDQLEQERSQSGSAKEEVLQNILGSNNIYMSTWRTAMPNELCSELSIPSEDSVTRVGGNPLPQRPVPANRSLTVILLRSVGH